MSSWKPDQELLILKVLSINVLTKPTLYLNGVKLVKLVNNPVEESKKIMKYCGLPWNKKCLEFYKRNDIISQTASNIQIRKAIYKDSIKKYLPYKPYLNKYGNDYYWYN